MTNLDKNVNFITAEDLLTEVKNDLRVYFERAVVDNSHLYPVIAECLSKLGSKIYPVGKTTLFVDNYKSSLPDDFHKLLLALACFDYKVTSTVTENPQLYEVSDSTIADFLVTGKSTLCTDECGDQWGIVQRFETFDVTFKEFAPLSISNSSLPYCANNCFNKSVLHQHQIDLSSKLLVTGFETGYIYMEYLQKLEKDTVDGKDILIPDFARIREWIKGACVKKVFQVMYWNNDADVQQRYHDSKNELAVLEANARSFVKQVDFKEMYDARKTFYSRYAKFEQVVYGHGNQLPHPLKRPLNNRW